MGGSMGTSEALLREEVRLRGHKCANAVCWVFAEDASASRWSYLCPRFALAARCFVEMHPYYGGSVKGSGKTLTTAGRRAGIGPNQEMSLSERRKSNDG